MTTNVTAEHERIAVEQGWQSYADAPPIVQNNIDHAVRTDGALKIQMREDP